MVLPTGAWPRALSFQPPDVRVSSPSSRLSFSAGLPFGAVTVIRSATITLALPARSSSSVTAPESTFAVETVCACLICFSNSGLPSVSCLCRSPVVDASHASSPAVSFRWSSVFMFCTACSPAASTRSRDRAYTAESSCAAAYQDHPPQPAAPAASSVSASATTVSGFLAVLSVLSMYVSLSGP